MVIEIVIKTVELSPLNDNIKLIITLEAFVKMRSVLENTWVASEVCKSFTTRSIKLFLHVSNCLKTDRDYFKP